jgi:transcriptional regulator with AAA-type ATPase domain
MVERALKAQTRRPGAPALPMEPAHSTGRLSTGVFVGRQPEMYELKASLDKALVGRGCLVTMVGEPGIGKTRTAEELASLARKLGVQVFWGRCPEERGAPTCWP